MRGYFKLGLVRDYSKFRANQGLFQIRAFESASGNLYIDSLKKTIQKQGGASSRDPCEFSLGKVVR